MVYISKELYLYISNLKKKRERIKNSNRKTLCTNCTKALKGRFVEYHVEGTRREITLASNYTGANGFEGLKTMAIRSLTKLITLRN